MALTEASQRGGSPQISQTPKRKTKIPSPAQNDERMVFHEIALALTEASIIFSDCYRIC